MMERNFVGTTIVVTCDGEGCGLSWVYDSFRGATFKAAREAAERCGWTITRTEAEHRDLCRYCSPLNRGRAHGSWARAGTPHTV